jgi:hypothetical protein
LPSRLSRKTSSKRSMADRLRISFHYSAGCRVSVASPVPLFASVHLERSFDPITLLPQAVAPAAKVYPQDELSPLKKSAGCAAPQRLLFAIKAA